MIAWFKQKTEVTMPLCTSGSEAWMWQPRRQWWLLPRDRVPYRRDSGASACKTSPPLGETVPLLPQAPHRRGLGGPAANMASLRCPGVLLKVLAAQAPPRILRSRSRFRKKSTSSSATETTWVRWANSTGYTECFFSALKSYSQKQKSASWCALSVQPHRLGLFSLSPLPLLRYLFFPLFCWGEAKGKVVSGGRCDFHNWIVITDSNVFRNIKESPPHYWDVHL